MLTFGLPQLFSAETMRLRLDQRYLPRDVRNHIMDFLDTPQSEPQPVPAAAPQLQPDQPAPAPVQPYQHPGPVIPAPPALAVPVAASRGNCYICAQVSGRPRKQTRKFCDECERPVCKTDSQLVCRGGCVD